MFDNISQGLFVIGGTGYMIMVPILRAIATLFMIISTYKILKARQDGHKMVWIFFVCVSPFLTRIAYEIYRRWIAKKEDETEVPKRIPKSSNILLILSILTFAISAILIVVSVITMGIGFIKSYIDDEPIAAAYDMNGNEYFDYFEVPLYDKEGNLYVYEPTWFTVGKYIDQNGNEYDATYCYLGEDEYFYFDKNNELEQYKDYDEYYTDGEKIYYSLWGYVYWDEHGTVYEKSGRLSIELFDFK